MVPSQPKFTLLINILGPVANESHRLLSRLKVFYLIYCTAEGLCFAFDCSASGR